MGCDIHTVLQVRREGNWETVATEVYDNRFYTLFGILAGVRCSYVDPIDEPRGLPADFVHTTKDQEVSTIDQNNLSFWMGYHSFSHLTLEELVKDKKKRKDEEEVEALDGLIDAINSNLQDKVQTKDVRLVFGFDS